MGRPKKAVAAAPVDAVDESGTSADETAAIEDGKILDYITGKPVADNDKETVRQRIARAMFHEYGISVDDMEPDFKVRVEESGRSANKKVDIAIFEPGSEHIAENVRRLVICQKELKIGEKGAYKMRDHDQADKEFGLLHAAMTELPDCKYGLWTNGLEFFFFHGTRTRFDVKFQPIGDWPMGDESIGTREVASHARHAARRPGDAAHRLPPLPQLHPRQRGHAQGRCVLAVPLPDLRQDVRREAQPQYPAKLLGRARRTVQRGRAHPHPRAHPAALRRGRRRSHTSIFSRQRGDHALSDRALAFMVSELQVRLSAHRRGRQGRGLPGDRRQQPAR